MHHTIPAKPPKNSSTSIPLAGSKFLPVSSQCIHTKTKSAARTALGTRTCPDARTEHAIKVNRQEYYAIITHMDVQIGRILDSLEKSGLSDSTYVFYSADHGLGVGHHGLLGKQTFTSTAPVFLSSFRARYSERKASRSSHLSAGRHGDFARPCRIGQTRSTGIPGHSSLGPRRNKKSPIMKFTGLT